MSDRPNEPPSDADLVAMVLPRIAAPGEIKTLPSQVNDQKHHDMAVQALEWQKLGSNAQLWELGATAQGAEEGRAYAVAGQMAAVGEQLGLAYGAGVEVALWDELRRDRGEEPEIEMGTRAMAEAQSYFVMGAGHGLANVSLYALAMHKPLQEPVRSAFNRKVGSSPFQPFSLDRGDWISMNPTNADRLHQVATQSASTEVHDLIQVTVGFAQSDEWTKLEERRGEDFHRWRPQSHGLAGVAKASPWTRPNPGTRALGLGPMPSYDSTEGLAQEVAQTANAGALRLTEAMHDFLDCFLVASQHLSGPKFGAT